jgi:hypothetical protein
MHWYYWALIVFVSLVFIAVPLWIVLRKRNKPKHKYKIVPTKYGTRCLPDDVNGTSDNSACNRFSKQGNQCVPDPDGPHKDGTCGGTVANVYYSCSSGSCIQDSSVTTHLNDPQCAGTCETPSTKIVQLATGEASLLPENTCQAASSIVLSSSNQYYVFTKVTSKPSSFTDTDTSTTVYRNLITFDPDTNQITITNESNVELKGQYVQDLKAGSYGNAFAVIVDMTGPATLNETSVVYYQENNEWTHKGYYSPGALSFMQLIGVVPNQARYAFIQNNSVLTATPSGGISSSTNIGFVNNHPVTHSAVRNISGTTAVFYETKKGEYYIAAQANSRSPFANSQTPSALGDSIGMDVSDDGKAWLIVRSDEVQYYEVTDPTATNILKFEYKLKGSWEYDQKIVAACISQDKKALVFQEEKGPLIVGLVDEQDGKFMKHTTTLEWKHKPASSDSLFMAPTSVAQTYVIMSVVDDRVVCTVARLA